MFVLVKSVLFLAALSVSVRFLLDGMSTFFFWYGLNDNCDIGMKWYASVEYCRWKQLLSAIVWVCACDCDALSQIITIFNLYCNVIPTLVFFLSLWHILWIFFFIVTPIGFAYVCMCWTKVEILKFNDIIAHINHLWFPTFISCPSTNLILHRSRFVLDIFYVV